jgi:hypothetical protein
MIRLPAAAGARGNFRAHFISGNGKRPGTSSIVHLSPQTAEQRATEQRSIRMPFRAVNQTGYDPSRAQPSNPAYLDPQPYQPSQPHVLKGAGRGAALGAVGGAIAGDAGKGAAAGAAMGGLAGGFRWRKKGGNKLLSNSRTLHPRLTTQQMEYVRAMVACLNGRGYSVK